MDGLKIPVALVFAMAVQLVALVWYISGLSTRYRTFTKLSGRAKRTDRVTKHGCKRSVGFLYLY